MAGSVSLGYCMWLDGSTISSQIARVQDVSSSFASGGSPTALASVAGVIPSVGALKVGTGSAMNITVNAGFGIVPNSVAIQGAYKAGSMSSTTLTVSTSDPSLNRIDLVVLNVTDLGTSGSSAYLQMVTGTAAASPVPPTAPAFSLVLAQIAVGAGVTSINSGNITDLRTYTAAAGGVVPYSATSAASGGYPGNLAYDANSDRFFHNKAPSIGSSNQVQMRTLPWAPVYGTVNTAVTLTPGVTSNVINVTFPVDGNTDVKTTVKWPSFYLNGGTTGYWQFAVSITIDSTQLDGMYMTVPAVVGSVYGGGGMHIYTTNSATGDTPTAGTHTMHFQVIANRVGAGPDGTPMIRGTAQQLIYMRVEPANL